ncbi:hypothetical protein F4809DRAFT_602183 [Biscogniauxia mediterranea]|nr:hypothetical protein F4809DRAFT_602183 [Biscogniauxia mediterranea]
MMACNLSLAFACIILSSPVIIVTRQLVDIYTLFQAFTTELLATASICKYLLKAQDQSLRKGRCVELIHRGYGDTEQTKLYCIGIQIDTTYSW